MKKKRKQNQPPERFESSAYSDARKRLPKITITVDYELENSMR